MSQSMEDLHIPKKDLQLPKEKADALPATKRANLPRNVRSVANVPDPSGHAPRRVDPPPTHRRMSATDAATAYAGPAHPTSMAQHTPPFATKHRHHLLPLHRYHRPSPSPGSGASPESEKSHRPPSPPHVNPNVDTSHHAGSGGSGSGGTSMLASAVGSGGGAGGGGGGGGGGGSPLSNALDANGSSSSIATNNAGSSDGLRNRLFNVRSDPSLADVPFDIWDDPSVSAPFAGRIGGNLAFTSSKFRHPDSHKIRDIEELLDFPGFMDPLYIRAACIEGVGTALLSFMISLNQLAAARFATSSTLAQATVEAVFTGTTTSMFIYATAAPTGGHLNPFVTMATVCAGLCTIPRGLYYLVAQTVGAIVANYILKLGVGAENFFTDGNIGGCTVDFSKSSIGQTYVMETMLYAVIAFMSFGVGLDPRQTPIFGPAYSQLLVGLTLTLTVWGSPFVHAGYGGISINPARCLGAQIARYEVTSSWIHWLAAFSASIINGLVYRIMPPATPTLVKKHLKDRNQ